MVDNVTTNTGGPRLMRRLMPFVLALIGLVFAALGAWSLYSLTWDETTGTVGECSTRTERSSSGKSRRVEQRCEVTWQAGGGTHTARLKVDDEVATGQPIALRADGDKVVVDGPLWLAAASAGVGVVVVTVAGVLIVRRRGAA